MKRSPAAAAMQGALDRRLTLGRRNSEVVVHSGPTLTEDTFLERNCLVLSLHQSMSGAYVTILPG
jgi:hypothetical protein